MTIRKGIKVRSKHGGPEMEVCAAGDSLAICEWLLEGVMKQEIFAVADLIPVAVLQQAQQQLQQAQQPQPSQAQQAQQPQPTAAPSSKD